MNVREFGQENNRHILLVHPSLVLWDYFERVIPLLEADYHVIVPVLPGYDAETGVNFTSVEQIADELTDWLNQNDCHELSCLYGCSMGGSVAIRMLAMGQINVKTAVLDGAITPYQLPRILTRLIAIRDFCMISLGKLGGIKLLEKVFSTDEYSAEDLQYVADIFKWISYKTIWRTFDSCNNYAMPSEVSTSCETIQYWYGDSESKERRWDIDYIHKHFSQAEFVCMENLGHAGMPLLRPEEFAERIKSLIGEEVMR